MFESLPAQQSSAGHVHSIESRFNPPQSCTLSSSMAGPLDLTSGPSHEIKIHVRSYPPPPPPSNRLLTMPVKASSAGGNHKEGSEFFQAVFANLTDNLHPRDNEHTLKHCISTWLWKECCCSFSHIRQDQFYARDQQSATHKWYDKNKNKKTPDPESVKAFRAE